MLQIKKKTAWVLLKYRTIDIGRKRYFEDCESTHNTYKIRPS